MDRCKYCELQTGQDCICVRVDRFFSDNWDLMYVWHSQAEYKFAYAIPKKDPNEVKLPVSGAV